mgnify:CR=1 FL=1
MKLFSFCVLFIFVLSVAPLAANENISLVDVENTQAVDGDGTAGGPAEDTGWMAAAGNFFSGLFSSEEEEKLGKVLMVTKLGGYGGTVDEMEERYEELNFDFKYLKNPDDEDFVFYLSMRDIVWVASHGGMRPDGFIFAQTTLLGKAKNEIHENYVRDNAPYFGPAFTIATACHSSASDGMAKAIGGHYVGFPRAVNIASMMAFGKNAMHHIADKIKEQIDENPSLTEDDLSDFYTEELFQEAVGEGVKNKITGSGYIRGIGPMGQRPVSFSFPRRGYE